MSLVEFYFWFYIVAGFVTLFILSGPNRFFAGEDFDASMQGTMAIICAIVWPFPVFLVLSFYCFGITMRVIKFIRNART